MNTLANEHLSALWDLGGQDSDALSFCSLEDSPPAFDSSFPVEMAAQTTLAAAALAACELGYVRGSPRQQVRVDARHAAIEATGWFSLDGVAPDLWDAFSGLYACGDGHVRIHANFTHHREGALRLLGLDARTATRADVEQALRSWRACDFEQAAVTHGLVVTALRTFNEWDASPQGTAVAGQPLLTIERIGDGPPSRLPALGQQHRPMSGVRALDLTRILAGPVAGRTLAALGADVMLINSPNLPNIAAIADTSRGKRSACLDLKTPDGCALLWKLIEGAHVFVQGYRPGALAALGFSPQALAARQPGIVQVSLSAYGRVGPWSDRRGFDSLVQTAMGFNDAEGQALGQSGPRALPMQILDQATGYLMAFGTATALRRQQLEGGSWLVNVSLAQTAQWLRSLPRRAPQNVGTPDFEPYLDTYPSGFGQLRAVRPSMTLERTAATYTRPSQPPGSDPASW